MIERYTITLPSNQLAERFSAEVPDFYKPRFNAAPTQLLPVITSAAPQGLSLFYWGTSPEWSKNKMLSEKIINLRRENFEEKPAQKRALMKTRCIVPADGFYLWRKVGKKTSIPYRFVTPAHAAFSFGGLWEEFEDTDGHQIQTFTMVTIPANEQVASVAERMPLVLTRKSEAAWLNKESTDEEIMAVVNNPENIQLNFYPVSPSISNTSQDLPSMIIPTPPADQHGNLTLFD